jgi:hypothetical protein
MPLLTHRPHTPTPTTHPRALLSALITAFTLLALLDPAVALSDAPPEASQPFFKPYGFIKPTIAFGNGVESYGFPNFSALTAAANPLFLANPDDMSLSFQVAQSRLGEGLPAQGILEVDFVHFDQSSPVQAAFPRLRIAQASWQINPHNQLAIGQNWDVFSPLNAHTFDFVGNSFQAGNSGFLRQQLAWFGTFDSLELVLAAGMQSPNNGSAIGNVELSDAPTLSLRAGYKPSKGNQVGVSAIATRLRFSEDKTRYAYAGNLFAELSTTVGGQLNLRFEAYGGANLGNLGALTLGYGHADADIFEAGGFLSGKHSFTSSQALQFVAGAAFVFNPDDMKLGYSPGDATTTPATSPTRSGANGPGIERNVNLRLGYVYTPVDKLSLVIEPFLMLTRHHLDDAARAKFDPNRSGYGAELGALYQF